MSMFHFAAVGALLYFVGRCDGGSDPALAAEQACVWFLLLLLTNRVALWIRRRSRCWPLLLVSLVLPYTLMFRVLLHLGVLR